MVKYWCTYVTNTNIAHPVGYRTLEGFLTDIVHELEDPNSDVCKFIIHEEHNKMDMFEIIHPLYK